MRYVITIIILFGSVANAQTRQDPQLTSSELLEAMIAGNSGVNTSNLYFEKMRQIQNEKKGIYYPPAQPKPAPIECKSYNSYGTVYTTCE